MENLELLVKKLCKYKDELPWLEFKHNNYDPDMIGADISALANGATLDERNYAYFLWGIDDKTHEIVGTEYNLQTSILVIWYSKSAFGDNDPLSQFSNSWFPFFNVCKLYSVPTISCVLSSIPHKKYA